VQAPQDRRARQDLRERQGHLRGRRDRRGREQGPARPDLEAEAEIAPNPRLVVRPSKQLPTLTPTISCLFSCWLGSLLRRVETCYDFLAYHKRIFVWRRDYDVSMM
jgi:hypothetical protein